MDRIIKIGDYVVNKFNSFGRLGSSSIVEVDLDPIPEEERIINSEQKLQLEKYIRDKLIRRYKDIIIKLAVNSDSEVISVFLMRS